MMESVANSAPPIETVAVKPKGIVPQNFQNWLMVGGGLLVVLFILLNSGGTSAKDKKASAAAEAAKPVIVDPSQARIQEYRNKIDAEAKKLEAEQARLQEVQQSMGLSPETRPAGAFQAMYPPGTGAPAPMPQAPQNMQTAPPRRSRKGGSREAGIHLTVCQQCGADLSTGPVRKSEAGKRRSRPGREAGTERGSPGTTRIFSALGF